MGIKTAVVQYKSIKKNIEKNIENIIKISKEALKENVKLIVFPEMTTTGYVFSDKFDILPYCETKSGKTFEIISQFAKENNCFIGYGFPEIEKDKLYNSYNLIDNNGNLILNYRKVNLYEADTTWATPGNLGYLNVDCELGKIGIAICMDLNFDDCIDWHIENKTQTLIFALNWLEQNINVRNYWRFKLGYYKNTVLITNTYGYDKGTLFCGQSTVFKKGIVEKTTQNTGESIIYTEI